MLNKSEVPAAAEVAIVAGTGGDEINVGETVTDKSNPKPRATIALDEPTLAALEEANDAVFVSSMDVASVRNVRKEIEVLATLNILPGQRHLILNFADRDSGLTVRDVEAVIGLPVNVVVPRAAEVSLSSNRGVPVLMEKKGGPAAKAMNNVVKRLEGEVAAPKLTRGRVPWALGIMAAVVAAAAIGWLDILPAAILGGLALWATGCPKTEETFASVHWAARMVAESSSNGLR